MAEIRDERIVFPFGAIWEDFGWRLLTFENLEEEREQLRVLATITRELGLDTPEISRERIAALVEPFGLDQGSTDRLVDQSWLIANWYFKEEHHRLLGDSLPEVKKKFQVMIDAGQRFADTLNLTPRTEAALLFVRPQVLDLFAPDHYVQVSDLQALVRDLVSVAERATQDMPLKVGPRRKYVRVESLRVAIEAAEGAFGERVGISCGTKEITSNHFTNAPGRYIEALFACLGDRQVGSLVYAVKALRRRRRK